MADLTGMMQAAAAGGEEPYVPIDVQEVFSTETYTGNGSTQVITTDLDFLNEGGSLVGISLASAPTDGRPVVADTDRSDLQSRFLQASTAGQDAATTTFVSNPTTTGYTLGNQAALNASGEAMVTWNFRKKSKFYTTVLYTGDGTSGRTIAHDLKAAPGMVIIKRINTTGNWAVWHQGIYDIDPDGLLRINSTDTSGTFGNGNLVFGNGSGNTIPPTAASFTVGNSTDVNASGSPYIAYLFANDAGGFGPDGTDNVITCGYYTGNGSATGPTVTLGYQPQFLLTKGIDRATYWSCVDAVRSPSNPRTKRSFWGAAISQQTDISVDFNATSFQLKTTNGEMNFNGSRYMYVAIRAPM
jgi:hypothetical protein